MGYSRKPYEPPEVRGFRVLRRAMNLFQEPYEMMFHTVAAGKKRTEARSQPAV